MDLNEQNPISRRRFFDSVQDGVHGAALIWLLNQEGFSGSLQAKTKAPAPPTPLDLLPRKPHFEAPAKAVIHLCMLGGPSQVDLFDPKPALTKYDGKPLPNSHLKGTFQVKEGGLLMASPWKFSKCGQSGMEVSELLPHMSQHMDEFAMIRSMYNVHPNHEPAIYKMQSGKIFPGHPTFGSWVTYGLGSENQNLPAYIVLADNAKRPTNAVANWMSGYLPPIYQGTPMRTTGSPMLNLQPGYEEPDTVTQAKRSLLSSLDRIHKKDRPYRPELDSRIRNYELAARMQLDASDAMDISKESQATLDMYGVGKKETDSFGRRCLLARRMIERGVRFVQLFPPGQMWDNHGNIRKSLTDACIYQDKPVAGLMKDLRQRGLIDQTLLLWGGEFGRLPMAQVSDKKQMPKAGRDHGPWGFTTLMAGAGVKGGTVHGATDEFGFAAVEDRVSIQDWHATILHLLGINHEELFFERNGLHEKLTHVFKTRVVKEILA
jgi:hypothetical protein